MRTHALRLRLAYLMRRFLFSSPFLLFLAFSEIKPLKKYNIRINTDLNIKGLDPKNLLFDTFIPSISPPNTRLIYDRGLVGGIYFITWFNVLVVNVDLRKGKN